MSVTITDERMTDDQTRHWAVPVTEGESYGQWVVSWLPDQHITRNQAITALNLAGAVATMQEEGRHVVVDHGHRLWPQIDQWASELGLTGPDAMVRVSEPDR